MNCFTIRDIENLSGIKAHTIRIWEQRYNLIKPQRTDTNIRWYCNEELKTILNIALLNKYGFKISQIDQMSREEINQEILSLDSQEARQERLINDMLQSMIDLDMIAFETIIDLEITANGIERTVTQLIFPFLEKIGLLWQTGRIVPAQEHLISNIIRQKLIAGIETTVPQVSMRKSFLLFLPEGEHHEMGLLFMYYLLKVRGARTYYLGANVPANDVSFVIKTKNPDVVYSHLTSTAAQFNFDRFLKNLAKTSHSNIVISGLVTRHYKKTIPKGIRLKTSLAEMIEMASENIEYTLPAKKK